MKHLNIGKIIKLIMDALETLYLDRNVFFQGTRTWTRSDVGGKVDLHKCLPAWYPKTSSLLGSCDPSSLGISSQQCNILQLFFMPCHVLRPHIRVRTRTDLKSARIKSGGRTVPGSAVHLEMKELVEPNSREQQKEVVLCCFW